ncbi:MAG TPA: DUF2207 domain-containing protein [Terriglobales bacterium]|nr:DUF2207 domain-containing protein [Terriglobales bacterium]
MRRLLLQLAIFFLPVGLYAAIPLNTFDTVIGIQRDGSVVVVERFAPAIPTAKVVWSTSNVYPARWTIHQPRVVNIIQVTGTGGRTLKHSVHNGFTRLELEIETAGSPEIRLVYAVRNAVQFLSDRDELLWNAGEGWHGETARTTLFVQVPPEMAQAFRVQGFVRGKGLVPVKESDAGPDRVWFDASRLLDARENLSADVIFPKGLMIQPSWGRRAIWFLGSNLILLLPVATLVVMLALRAMKRLPSPEEASITTRYEPPDALTPAEVGLLVDDVLNPRDITATIIDLAIRGNIRLESCKPDEGIDFAGKDFIIRLLRPRDEWVSLALHERTVLFHMFYGGEWTKLSSLSLRFYSVVPLVRRQVVQLLRGKGMYWTDPGRAMAVRMNMLLGFLAVAFVIQVAGLLSFASSTLLSGIAIACSAAIVYYFGRHITSKTLRGIHACEQIVGFQHFLDSVERDRLERLPAQLFEKWLPYAIALGVEQHWAQNFETVAIAQFEWFGGLEEAVFDTAGLAKTLEFFTSQTAGVLLTVPRSYPTWS